MTPSKTPHPQPLTPKRGEGSKSKKMWESARDGLTVLEVLFSMAILLIGLLGVALMIPFAGRQAESAISTTQSLALGQNALAMASSLNIAHPRTDTPWQFVDDMNAPDSVNSAYSSFRRLYVHRQQVWIKSHPDDFPATMTAANFANNLSALKISLANVQNNLIGQGFCIDPLFWGYQPRGIVIARKDPSIGYFRRTAFPYYDEDMTTSLNPLDSLGGTIFTTPRLSRVSFHDPSADASGNSGWLRLPAALQLSNASGGDLVMATPQSDRSLGPIRGATLSPSTTSSSGGIIPGDVIAASKLGSNVSWVVTLTPSDSCAIIDASSLNIRLDAGNNVIYPDIAQFPDTYEMSVVVFNRRDVREVLSKDESIAAETVPSSERLFSVTNMGPDGMTSGSFDIELSGSNVVDSKVRVGDWLMLSRYVLDGATSGSPIRQRHKWYRVISVSGADTLPRRVRVAGLPWGWTKVEVDFIVGQIQKGSMTATTLSDVTLLPATVATLPKNVIQVYQRNVTAIID